MRRGIFKRVVSLATGVAMTAALLAGCGSSSSTASSTAAASGSSTAASSGSSSGGSYGGTATDTVTFAMASAWKDLIPYNDASGGYYSAIVMGMLYDRLAVLDAEGNLSPRGADSWELSDDRKSITFHLSQKAKWSDGEPVTADDYVFAVKEITDPDCVADRKSVYNILENVDITGNTTGDPGIEKVDDYTIIYHCQDTISEAVNFQQNFIYYYPLPEHLLSDVAPADYLTADLWNHPVGSGPCIFESTVPGSELVMKANKNYQLGAPGFETLRIEVMATSNMASSIISGDIDLCYPYLSSDDIETLKAVGGNVVVEHDDTPYQPWMIFINQLVYNDSRINQAIDLAIDRDAIAAMLKNAEPAESPILKGTKYYDETCTTTRDVEKAKELFQEAAADGSIDLSQPLVINTPSGPREQVASIIQQNLQEAGLTVEIQVQEAATMFSGLFSGTVGIALVNASYSSNPMWLKTFLTNDSASYINVQDDTWDDMYAKFVAAGTEEEEIAVAKEYQQLWLEKEPCIFYAASYEDYPHSARLGNAVGLLNDSTGNVTVWNWCK
ncbi:MAG: ABC transporter substrate-binding protein [Lachnospiraceae bacterium]|nr:ABC transporter substrate-binding protein [Lachnospiraceae bacterium]MCH4069977.1 ABC transporter substrate-binding protein [Lachnospiraceae bacterium]MCH4108670.1 ABC transporter substrate-binding protein [Lachnospiraceae bacterium]MCI1302821.1 ABC transporter substrate-binding protein [Lachnospiraceae bacterium]MCI1332042.1 ABC transporter substrate-binding protein [Lachnospiraceae bacterium]